MHGSPARPSAIDTDPLRISVSYTILRNGIGALGLALPCVLVLGAGLDHVQGSLSAYYHFSPVHPAQYGAGTMRDAFVGMLCTIGAFLFFYRGHTLQEDIALNIAGVCAVLIAMLPMDWPIVEAAALSTTAKLHSACAITFFVMIAFVLFRAHDTLRIMPSARHRRLFGRIYLLFALAMLATPATIVVLRVLLPHAPNSHATFAVEVGGVLVFSSYWLVKGQEIRLSLRAR